MADEKEPQRLYIGQVAKLTGVSTSALRQWERHGLVVPQRSASGYRTYSVADVERCKRIRDRLAEDRLGVVAVRHVLAREQNGAERTRPPLHDESIGVRLRHMRIGSASRSAISPPGPA